MLALGMWISVYISFCTCAFSFIIIMRIHLVASMTFSQYLIIRPRWFVFYMWLVVRYETLLRLDIAGLFRRYGPVSRCVQIAGCELL